MESLLIFHIALCVISIIVIGLTVIAKDNRFLSILSVFSSMFTGFIGFMNFASLSRSYPNRKILALLIALTFLIPPILSLLRNYISDIKTIFVKCAIILIISINVIIMIFL